MTALGRRWRFAIGVALVAAVTGALAVVGLAASSAGTPPPEYQLQTDSWPAHNYDLSNSRDTTHSDINSTTVAGLHKIWQFKIPGTGFFGNFATTPVVQDGVVYMQDLNSNVYALNQLTGKLEWEHKFKAPTIGPNGVAVGYGHLYAATESTVYALNLSNGAVLWSRKLTPSVKDGIDMAPQLYDNKVLISTVPGSGVKHFYEAGAVGVVFALDAATGKKIWSFDTVPAVKKGEISGGGLWYPPAVGADGGVYLGVANPGLWPNSPKNVNGALRPGRNLYTDSLVKLNGETGKVVWYRQVIKHDVRDYDLMISPVLYTSSTGAQTIIGAGKMGKVFAWNALNGQALWERNVGKHVNDIGPLPKKQVTICPGDYGGVETPMAESNGTLFVPWLN